MDSFNKYLIGCFFIIYTSFSFAQSITINQIPLDFNHLSFSLMPGDTAFIKSKLDKNIRLISNNETIDFTHNYSLIAPQSSGIYTYQIISNNNSYHINLLVMKSMNDIKNTINDFKIGNYPSKLYKNLPQYKVPKGMIEVTRENENTYVSEHFQLKDFLVKQASGYPKFVLIDDKLIFKLELIFQKLQKSGFDNLHIHVMSGYRTPYYNTKIGNGNYSRHIYGDAADIYIDNDHNGGMDDLNKDGSINKSDAKKLAAIIKKIDDDPKYIWLIGGIGIYGPNSAHRGFVHVDTRGFKARW